MIRLKLSYFIGLLWICSCSNVSQQEPREEAIINSGWEFVKVFTQKDSPKSKVNDPKVQNGDHWESQFFIEHIATSESTDSTINWQVILDKELNGVKDWESVNLPHAAHIEDYEIEKQWEGVCYYKKQIFASGQEKGKKFFIKFEGAMQVADVWVNGQHLTRHLGGYLPFTVDISSEIKYGSENEILVRLDNRDNPLIPPGKPLDRLDFCYHHGLYRNVKLIKTNQIYITDAVHANKVAGGGLFVSYPIVSSKLAKVNVKTHVKWEDYTGNVEVVHILKDHDGNLIQKKAEPLSCEEKQSDRSLEASLNVKEPNLWSVDQPYQYTLVAQIWEEGVLLDEVSTKVGIRNIEISREKGFLLNDQAIRLVGTNRHMEYPWVGNAVPDRAQYRDLVKIKKAGFNTVRLGHYPQSPSVYDICDSIGLMIINPMPGWQFFNKDSLFCERSWQDIRDMVRRDRNHPSVVIWETILNESWPPKWWRDKAHEVAHKEYPGDQMFTAGDMYGYFGWDVLYNDWSEDHTRPNNSENPGFIREYGDYEFGGHNSTTRITNVHGEKALLQNAWNFIWSHNKHRGQYPWTIGDANWSMYDYNRGCAENICYSGIAELNRRPKFSYHFFQSQMNVGDMCMGNEVKPMIFVANHWTMRDTADKVVVFSNVDEVELRVNGKLIAKQKPDHGPNTPYAKNYKERINGGHAFDGGNGKNLQHPPFTFKNVKWEAGELEAIGYIDGKVVVQDKIRTPEKSQRLKVELDTEGLTPLADGSDLLFVRVKIQDAHGTLCVEDNSDVNIRVEGADVISPSVIKAEAGMATFLVQMNKGASKLSIKSASGSLRGEDEFNTILQP
jgi:Beta-galactosidase/beta-glucuronidase